MPIYEYKCQKCGNVYEKLQKEINGKTAPCSNDDCGGLGKKIMSVVSFEIKGYSYKNGYSNPSDRRK